MAKQVIVSCAVTGGDNTPMMLAYWLAAAQEIKRGGKAKRAACSDD